MNRKEQKGITLVALVITVIITLILAGVGISLITGEDGLFTKANEAATKYNQASQNEATKLQELLNSEYLSGLNGFELAATSTTSSITITGNTTGNGTISYKYAIYTEPTEVNWDSISATSDTSKTFTTLMDGSTAIAEENSYYVYMQALDENNHTTNARNNGTEVIAVAEGTTNLSLANGSYDKIAKVNSPDVSKLNTANFSYVTWVDNSGNNSNTADATAA